MNKIVKTLLQHHKTPEDFEIYLRHEFEDGTFICLYKLKATPLPGQPFRIGAPVLEHYKAWIDYGALRYKGSTDNNWNTHVDGRSFDDDTQALFDFSRTTIDIVNGEVAITLTPDEDGDIAVEVECY